jgi:gluconolactonase
MREIASGLQFPEGPIAMPDGSVLLVEIKRGTLSRVAPDGAVSVVAETGGGPNGAAIGPDGACYVVNNGGFKWSTIGDMTIPMDLETHSNEPDGFEGGWVERVDLAIGEHTILYDGVDGHRFRSPNDIVFDETGGFWFTDLGKARPREVDKGGLYYAAADGSSVVEVAHGLWGANGVGLSPEGDRVYVAESYTGEGRTPEPRRDARPLRLARGRGGRHGGGRSDRRRPVRHPSRLEPRVRADARPVHHQHLLRGRRPPHRARHAVGHRQARCRRLASPRPEALLRVIGSA